jgi:hypothetical protein
MQYQAGLPVTVTITRILLLVSAASTINQPHLLRLVKGTLLTLMALPSMSTRNNNTAPLFSRAQLLLSAHW